MSTPGSLFPFTRSYGGSQPPATNAYCHIYFDLWWNWLRRRGYVG